MECYAGASAAALAESVSALAGGDVLGEAGGDAADSGLLGVDMVGEKAVFAVSGVGWGDAGAGAGVGGVRVVRC